MLTWPPHPPIAERRGSTPRGNAIGPLPSAAKRACQNRRSIFGEVRLHLQVLDQDESRFRGRNHGRFFVEARLFYMKPVRRPDVSTRNRTGRVSSGVWSGRILPGSDSQLQGGSCKTLVDREPDPPQSTGLVAIGNDCRLERRFVSPSGDPARAIGNCFGLVFAVRA